MKVLILLQILHNISELQHRRKAVNMTAKFVELALFLCDFFVECCRSLSLDCRTVSEFVGGESCENFEDSDNLHHTFGTSNET
jgi:hypothetical protein